MRYCVMLLGIVVLMLVVPTVAPGDELSGLPIYPGAEFDSQEVWVGASVLRYKLPSHAGGFSVWAFYEKELGLTQGWKSPVRVETPWGLVRVCTKSDGSGAFGVAVSSGSMLLLHSSVKPEGKVIATWTAQAMAMASPPVAFVGVREISGASYYARLQRMAIPTQSFVSAQAGKTVLQHTVITDLSAEAGKTVLQNLIREQLLLMLAAKEQVSPTEEQVQERVNQARKQAGFEETLTAAGITSSQLTETMRVQQAGFNLQTKGIEVSDQEIKDFYEKYRDTVFTDAEQADVAAIFTDNKSQMDKAVGLLKQGVDFGTVARTLSTHPASAKRDGRLARAIMRGDQNIPESVQDLLLSTARNKYTEPIPYGESGGFVIFKVVKHYPRQTHGLEDVEFRIRERLMVEKGVKQVDLQRKLSEFRRDIPITMNILRYEENPDVPE